MSHFQLRRCDLKGCKGSGIQIFKWKCLKNTENRLCLRIGNLNIIGWGFRFNWKKWIETTKKDKISYLVLYHSDMGSYLASGLWFFEISTCRNFVQRIHSDSGRRQSHLIFHIKRSNHCKNEVRGDDDEILFSTIRVDTNLL